MITSNGLEKLGFTPNVDFVLQDDGDGVYNRPKQKSKLLMQSGNRNTILKHTQEQEPKHIRLGKHKWT